jgi:hypothetical protein
VICLLALAFLPNKPLGRKTTTQRLASGEGGGAVDGTVGSAVDGAAGDEVAGADRIVLNGTVVEQDAATALIESSEALAGITADVAEPAPDPVSR